METSNSTIEVPTAADIAARVPIEKLSRRLLRDGMSAIEFARVLADANQFGDAIRVVAHLLPPREAVWWACQCARQNPAPDPEPEQEIALAAAEKWVTEMSEESRYAAKPVAEAAGFGTAAGCVAMAAFTSGGSMGPPDQQEIPPDPSLTPQLVTGSITVSSLLPNPTGAPERFRSFLSQGIELYYNTSNQ
jgi:hypothetical protein